jgi:hypothetical protein
MEGTDGRGSPNNPTGGDRMKLVLSGTLLRFVDYQSELALEASTPMGALNEAATRFPSLKPVLFDGAGTLRTMHRLFVNGEQIPTSEVGRDLREGDCLEVLTAIAGG